MEQLAEQDPVPQRLCQVEDHRRGPDHPVVRGQNFAVDEPAAALPPLLHGRGPTGPPPRSHTRPSSSSSSPLRVSGRPPEGLLCTAAPRYRPAPSLPAARGSIAPCRGSAEEEAGGGGRGAARSFPAEGCPCPRCGPTASAGLGAPHPPGNKAE